MISDARNNTRIRLEFRKYQYISVRVFVQFRHLASTADQRGRKASTLQRELWCRMMIVATQESRTNCNIAEESPLVALFSPRYRRDARRREMRSGIERGEAAASHIPRCIIKYTQQRQQPRRRRSKSRSKREVQRKSASGWLLEERHGRDANASPVRARFAWFRLSAATDSKPRPIEFIFPDEKRKLLLAVSYPLFRVLVPLAALGGM